MATWKDSTKILFVGLSGLQYQTAIETNKPLSEVLQIARDFYVRRKAFEVTPQGNSDSIAFIRGKRWCSFLPIFPETMTYQAINLSGSQKQGHSVLTVSYDAWMYLSLIVSPNKIKSEADALRLALK